MATTTTLGRVVGSMIYTGSANTNATIQQQLTALGVTPLKFDLYASTTGNLFQYQLVDSTLNWSLLLNLTGPTGTFAISKVYNSVASMNAGYSTDGVPVGGLAVIETGSVQNADNAKLYVKGNVKYDFLTDMSGTQGLVGQTGATGATGGQGPQGQTGNGITSITKTNTSGLVDTYTILFSNNNTSTFTVTNGEKGNQGIQGVQGIAGPQGTTGPTGSIGPTGATGATGQTPVMSINANGELVSTIS